MPEEKLADGHIETLIRWVRQGAYDDRTVEPRSGDALDWWSLKPLVAPPVPARGGADTTAVPHPIDAFIETRLAAAGLSLSPAAEPRDLIRRLSFDLVGLPPSPEELEQEQFRPYVQQHGLAALCRVVLNSTEFLFVP